MNTVNGLFLIYLLTFIISMAIGLMISVLGFFTGSTPDQVSLSHQIKSPFVKFKQFLDGYKEYWHKNGVPKNELIDFYYGN